jgi:hypothetical protein
MPSLQNTYDEESGEESPEYSIMVKRMKKQQECV